MHVLKMMRCDANKYGYTEIVKLLLSAGADVHAMTGGITSEAPWVTKGSGHHKTDQLFSHNLQ